MSGPPTSPLARALRRLGAVCLVAALAGGAAAQTPGAAERTMRYRADGQDFVVENGTGRFNRALYGPNDAFRVDAGERPDLALALPAKGGLVRLGVASATGTRWLASAQRVTARYRAGSMIYEVRDPAVGSGVMTVTVLPLKDADGLMLRAELSQGGPVDLVWSFGGASGAAGTAEAWTFSPADYEGGTFKLSGASFEYTAKGGSFNGAGPADGRLALADAGAMDNLDALLASRAGDRPVLVGRASIRPGAAAHVVVQRAGKAGPRNPAPLALANLFKTVETARTTIVAQAAVDTPDPQVNAAVAALAVAADALWEDPSLVSAAVGARQAIPGWRGPQALLAFGWFDRSAKHLGGWAGRQVSDPAKVPTAARPDPSQNLAGDDGTMLLSNGSLPVSGRDMNLSFASALLRHLRWTGDVALARQWWPFLERHFEREKRLFDRDGLHEPYAPFANADGLAYGGGGATSASAEAYFQRKLAAQVATLIGQDPAPHRREMTWIADAVNHDLWQPAVGWYAEYRDTFGQRLVHPAPSLWSLTRAVDAELPAPLEAYQTLRYLDTELPRLPVRGAGVPEGDWFVLPTVNWPGAARMNSVGPGESAQAALALWQAGRPDDAWNLWKGVVLDAMFLGRAPGDVPARSALDPLAATAAERDDADAVGSLARATVEGLFGILPDVPAGELVLRPGYPADWDRATLRTPYLGFTFRREGQADRYIVEPKFSRPLKVRLVLRARGERVLSVQANGKPAAWTNVADAVGDPAVEIALEPAAKQEVVVTWVGERTPFAHAAVVAAKGRTFAVDFAPARVADVSDPQGVLGNANRTESGLSGTIGGQPGPRTVFAKLQQGGMTWWQPVLLDVRPGLEIVPSPVQDAQRVRFRVRNNTNLAWDRSAVVDVGGQKSTLGVRVAAMSESAELVLPAGGQLPGTIAVRVELGELGVAEGTVVNWELPVGTATLRPVDLGTVFNDEAGRIFRNEYLQPRPERASLQLPKQGLGSWAEPQRTFAVDDAGLRRSAAGDQIRLPQGIVFKTPSAAGARNVAFTSRWKNYPEEVSFLTGGRFARAYLLLVGSTNPMQSRLDNAEIIATYRDGTTDRLALNNPANWWPVEQDFTAGEDPGFRPGPLRPLRLELGTGRVYVPGPDSRPAGGAATIVDLPLDPDKNLLSLTLRTLANDAVVGVMAVTLAR
jgi:hypothetical protein